MPYPDTRIIAHGDASSMSQGATITPLVPPQGDGRNREPICGVP